MRIKQRLIITLAFGVSACSKSVPAEDTAIKAKVSVEVVPLARGIVKDELTLFANTLYLKRNVVTAPIPSFITQVYIKLGDPVKEGQVLYHLELQYRPVLS